MKQVRYNIDNIDKKNARFNIIYGERSNGKSYQVKHKKAIEHYLKTGMRFILLRRYREEITSEKIEQYFNDVDVRKITNDKYNCITMFRRALYFSFYDIEKNVTVKGEKIGYVVALSTEQNYAGASYLDVDNIIFEEFMSRSMYLPNENNKLMNFYATVDRKRLTTRLWLIGNTISRVCPYLNDWNIQHIVTRQKQGTIEVIDYFNENDTIKIAIEYCRNTGNSSGTIGNNSKMINTGAWQSDPQPQLEKSKKCYNVLYRFGFQYENFKFLCEFLQDKEETYKTCFFIYPYYNDFDNDIIVFSDLVKIDKNWQRNIYNITINNNKLREFFSNFRENNIFFASDLCGTDFKQCIDFTIIK